MRDLTELRQEIDKIDSQIVELIEKRMGISKEVGDFKKSNGLPVLDEKREEQVIENRAAFLKDKSMQGDIREIFSLIMKLSREKQVR